MKKIVIVISLVLLFTGCSNRGKIFEEYSRDYYDNHMRMVGNVDSVVITLEDLINASSEDDYNLKIFKKCDKQSKVIFSIDKVSNNILNSEINLNC